MQNGMAAHAALRTLRSLSASTAASGLSRHSYSSCREGAFIRVEGLRQILHIPLYQQLCRRAPLGLHIAMFSNGTETSIAIDLPSPNTFEASVPAEQGCASTTLGKLNVKGMSRFSESEPSEGNLSLGESCISSSPQLFVEVCKRLKHLDNVMEQQSRSLDLLTSQLEAQKQSLDSILDEIKCLKVDRGWKVQCSSPPSDYVATLDIVDVPARGTTDQRANPLPEWTHFIVHLKSLPFFKELIQAPEVSGVSSADNSTIIKQTVQKFSQAYDYIFDALSGKHLQILADYGCPNDDRRTVASYKRLKDYFDKEKKSDNGGAASLKLFSVKPKLLDVMRLIYMIAELAKKDGVPDKVKLSIMHLLEEITKLTTFCKHHHIARLETFSNAGAVSEISFKEKNSSLKANLQVQGPSASSDAESLSGECPSVQQHGKRDSNFDTVMPKSTRLATNRIYTKVCVPGEEDKEPSVLAYKRHMEMPISGNNRQAVTMKGSPDEKRLIGAQEQVLQECILSEKEEKFLGGAGVRDDSDAVEHPDIFDDIFDQGDTSSLRAEPKCSLSELIRQNKKAFSTTKKEREQEIASGTDVYGKKGLGTSADKEYKYDDNDTKRRAMLHTDDSDIESEDKYMRQNRRGGGCASRNQSLGIQHNHSSNIAGSLGKGFAGRVDDDDRRRRTKSMQRSSREGDLDAESEENFVSSRTRGNERFRFKESKHRGHRDGNSDTESDSREAFDRRRREGSSRY